VSKPRFLVSVTSLCLLVGACSSSPGASDPGSSAAAGGAGKESMERGAAPGDGRKDRSPADRVDERDGKRPGTESDDGGGATPGSSGPGTDGRRDRWSAGLTDPVHDLDSRGDAPRYVDLTAVSVRGGDEAVTFTISTAGDLPAQMPDLETNALMTVGFEKNGDEYFLQGEASTSGWSASISRNGRAIEYRGRFSIDGNRVTFEVPWRDIGGRSGLRWSVDSSWTRTTMLQTDYAFDRAPQFGREAFPAR
jgi:hypothetical protein